MGSKEASCSRQAGLEEEEAAEVAAEKEAREMEAWAGFAAMEMAAMAAVKKAASTGLEAASCSLQAAQAEAATVA